MQIVGKEQMMYPTIDAEKTGKQLKKLMQERHLTPRDIQRYLNLSCVQSVYHWLDGSSLPALDHLYALSGLFRTSMDTLVCGSKDAAVSWKNSRYRRLFAYVVAFRQARVGNKCC